MLTIIMALILGILILAFFEGFISLLVLLISAVFWLLAAAVGLACVAIPIIVLSGFLN